MVDSAKLVAELQRTLDRTAVPVVCAYLYGSYALARARPDSDVDLAVLLGSVAQQGLLGPLATLRGELERAVGRDVDLIDLHRAPPDLVHRVLRDGQLLVDRDPNRRAEFEVQARNAYFDLLPYLSEYRQGRVA